MMSQLRIIGLIIGIVGFYLTFRVYRGPKWKRFNFLFWGILSLFFIAISLNPDFLNSVTNMLTLGEESRGRILALLIFSNIFLWFISLYLKTRLDFQNHQFDLLIRNLGQEEVNSKSAEEIKNKEIMIIIPAYNEEDNLAGLLSKIPSRIMGKEVGVVVVDDGSDDNTSGVVEGTGFLCVKNKINRGQGAASRLGYDVLLKHNIKIGVTMDSDGQHLPEDIEKLVKPILENKKDLVIGSRFLGRNESKGFVRNTGIKFFSKIINFLTNLNLTDSSSGFKAFNMEKTKDLKFMEDQFQSAEVIIESVKKGLRIGEVPITVAQRQHGETKKGKNWTYGINFAKVILRSWWR